MRARTIRCGGIGVAALAVVATLASSAPAEHSVLEQVSIGGNGEASALWLGASEDGTRVFFETDEALPDTGDTDATNDIYERSGDRTVLRSPGTSFADFLDASDDGSVILVRTGEQLDPVADKDPFGIDLYLLREGAPPELVSGGPTSGSNQQPAENGLLAADGSAVAFSTADNLIEEDADPTEWTDVYLWTGGELTLVSTGANAPDAGDHSVFAISDDGSRVVFMSNAPLLATDEGTWDVYARDAGAAEPELLSDGTTVEANFAGASPDLATVVFGTLERLTDTDTDDSVDLYKVVGNGAAQHVTTGPAGGNGNFAPGLEAVSADGSRVVFTSYETLVDEDVDEGQRDVWVNDDGVTALVSAPAPGSIHGGSSAFFDWASADAERIIFSYTGALTGDDTDSGTDVYERADGTTTLLSKGTNGGTIADSSFAGASADGSRVIFRTDGQVEPGDEDEAEDVYERHAGTTTLISVGPGTGNGDFEAEANGISADGSRVWFSTEEPLLPSDTDIGYDLYEKSLADAPVNTAAPAISGAAVAGRAVLCTNGTWSNAPTAYAYQWRRDGAPIAGATSQPYVIAAADVGHKLTCTVTASNGGGSATATSAPVTPTAAQVTPPPPPPEPGGPLSGACANVQRGDGGKDRLRRHGRGRPPQGPRRQRPPARRRRRRLPVGRRRQGPPQAAARARTSSPAARASTASTAAAATTSSPAATSAARSSAAGRASATASSPTARTSCAGASGWSAAEALCACSGRAGVPPCPMLHRLRYSKSMEQAAPSIALGRAEEPGSLLMRGAIWSVMVRVWS